MAQRQTMNSFLTAPTCQRTICILFLLIGSIACSNPCKAQEDQALAIAQTASTAQNAGSYKFAAGEWKKLVDKFPQSELAPKAHFNAGVCFMYIGDFDEAAGHFKTAAPKLEAGSIQKPESKLFLGFCQLRMGQQAIEDDQKDQANRLLTTATQTLAELIKAHQDFENIDQAFFYQGESFEELNRSEEALAAYEKVLQCKKQTNKLETLYAIGFLYDQLGQPAKAVDFYRQHQTTAQSETGDPERQAEVDLRIGSGLMTLATADENANNEEGSFKRLTEADAVLTSVAGQPLAEATEFTKRVIQEAKFELAFCKRRLGKYVESAKLFSALAADNDSQYADESAINAGRSYLDAGDLPQATSFLERVINSNSKYADTAAHWLANTYLDNNQADKAYELTTAQLAKPSTKSQVRLMMDQADAAYAIPDRLKESVKLYKNIAEQHPDDPMADRALHNAVFAELDLEDYAATIKTADQFVSKYKDSEYLPDTLELKAEASLFNDDPATAAKILDDLIVQFPTHKNNAFWQLRSGVSQYRQDNYDSAIAKLTPAVEKLQTAQRKSRALFWIGCSQFQLKNYAGAITALTQCNEVDNDWQRADEALLMLCRSQLGADKIDDARKTGSALAAGFPDSKFLASLYYYVGDKAYTDKQFADALKDFDTIIKDHPKSELVPLALYKAAWSQIELKDFKASEVLFDELINKFPNHELAKEAKIGRGSMRRKTGNVASSIQDLKDFLKTAEGPSKVNGLYELGLAEIEAKRWDDAIGSLTDLIAIGKESDKYDFFCYDLAWAYKYRKLDNADAEDRSTEYFKKIVDEKPESELAGESNFHIGVAAYDAKQYDEAAQAFKASFDSKAAENVRQKAGYKLGWSYYKRNQFADAHQSFSDQLEAFPTGELAADTAFMKAESLFRQKKYNEAVDAYVAAKPMVENATDIQGSIKSLTLLHGSQAANKAKRWNEAKDMATSLSESGADLSLKQDAWLELGTAYTGLNENEKAVEAWTKAGESLSKTGARANCMIGDRLFKLAIESRKTEDFETAVDQFKRVYFGYGGTQANEDIRPWQAYAVYESARCYFVQIKDAPAALRNQLRDQAIDSFEYLLKHYPGDALAKEASKQLEVLKKLK